MKLFRSVCIRVFGGMAVLAILIPVFLLSAMLHQSIADAGSHGREEIKSRLFVMRDFVQREKIEQGGDVADALIDNKFREVFGTRGVLWKDGRQMWNASPYQYDQQALYELSRQGEEDGLFVSDPQYVDHRWQIVFYREHAGFGRDDYSFAYYEDVTDIYARVWRLFLCSLCFDAALFCVVGALLYYSIRRMFDPLEQLRRAAMRVADGVYGGPPVACGKDEIGELAESFNRMAEKVNGQMEALCKLNEKQTLLLGSLSHEMKTPMAAMIGNADLLLTVRLGEQERERALHYILDEAGRLSRLSQKMAELTGLYAHGASEITLEQTGVQTLFKRLERSTKALLEEKKLSFLISCEPEGLEKRMDADLSLSLLQNLVDNASKASFVGGRICISADREKICVQDFGTGIPKKEIAHVTEAFYTVDKSRTRRRGGLGLGLALCSRIADLHGWELHIASAEGSGTRICLFW